jgi:hypothetical protein
MRANVVSSEMTAMKETATRRAYQRKRNYKDPKMRMSLKA